jgi:hypothetical protein
MNQSALMGARSQFTSFSLTSGIMVMTPTSLDNYRLYTGALCGGPCFTSFPATMKGNDTAMKNQMINP